MVTTGLTNSAPSPKHDQAHAYCKALAERVAATDPDRYTTNATLIKRPGRLFIDYLRNGRGTTAIGTYSPRARSGFPIAAPVTWKQLQRGIRPDAFHMFSPFVSKDCDRCPRCCPRIEFNEGTVPKPLKYWWARQDSNLQPDGYEPSALTIELRALKASSSSLRNIGTAPPPPSGTRCSLRVKLGCPEFPGLPSYMWS